MSVSLSTRLLQATTSDTFESIRKKSNGGYSELNHTIDVSRLDDADMQDIIAAANSIDDKKTARAIESILLARVGEFSKPVPSFKAFQGMLTEFLKQNVIDGWIYVNKADRLIYPELVTSVTFDADDRGRGVARPEVCIHTCFYGFGRDNNQGVFGTQRQSYRFDPQDVTNRKIVDALEKKGLYKETVSLKNEHLRLLDKHHQTTIHAFAEQFRVNGIALYYEVDDYKRRGTILSNRKVIHDLDLQSLGAITQHIESDLFGDDSLSGGVGEIPEHPVVRVFDLNTHEFFWVHSENMTSYVYDKTLRDKLILPKTHKDLLDVLTTDLDAFIGDIIEGKSAGNVILCKGIPGVGKTLTAEVMSSVIERPLYSISAGNLGTEAEQISKNLQRIFLQAKRWNCVLLIDEADVFTIRRGTNIEQNAIVSEFLRAMEYFDGLLFMTTNRPDDIDDAIISRCAAIINYSVPDTTDVKHIWQVMSDQYDAKLNNSLIDALEKMFIDITPRDIKMLLRLALRVANSRSEPLSLDIFRQCAMFRAVEIRPMVEDN